MVALVIAGVYRTELRIPDWETDENLFESALVACPNSAKHRNQVGKVGHLINEIVTS